MFQAEIQRTFATQNRNNFFCLTSFHRAPVSEHFSSTFRRVRLTITVNVSPNSNIRGLAPSYRNWRIAQGANRHLDIFLIRWRAVMVFILEVIITTQKINNQLFIINAKFKITHQNIFWHISHFIGRKSVTKSFNIDVICYQNQVLCSKFPTKSFLT